MPFTEITLKYPTKCAQCGRDLPAGTRAKYDDKKAYCLGVHLTGAPADKSGVLKKENELLKAVLTDINARIQQCRSDITELYRPPPQADQEELFPD